MTKFIQRSGIFSTKPSYFLQNRFNLGQNGYKNIGKGGTMTTAIIIAIVVALLGIAGTIATLIRMRRSLQRKTTELEKDLEAEYEAAMNDIKED